MPGSQTPRRSTTIRSMRMTDGRRSNAGSRANARPSRSGDRESTLFELRVAEEIRDGGTVSELEKPRTTTVRPPLAGRARRTPSLVPSHTNRRATPRQGRLRPGKGGSIFRGCSSSLHGIRKARFGESMYPAGTSVRPPGGTTSSSVVPPTASSAQTVSRHHRDDFPR